jgi:uncharacterized protein with GYD domain
MALIGDRPKGEPQGETFFLLFKFTDEGIRNVKRQSERVKRANEIVSAAGATCVFYLAVAGPYDMVSVVTGISDLDLTRLVLALNSVGTVKTTVLKALSFYADEYAKFLATLP